VVCGHDQPTREPDLAGVVAWRGEGNRSMFLHLSWRLPRTPATVAMLRRVLNSALHAVGVTEDCRYDIVLALTEACANAVEHARTGPDYCVTVVADSQRCSVEVVDSGIGLPAGRREKAPVTITEPRGRGLRIIRACTDSMDVDVLEPHGVAVRFTKKLTWEPTISDQFMIPAA
jgi:serine/threonine-protein kinase RsbW